MCVFCVRIWIFKRLCAMYADLRTLCGLCIRNISFAHKATLVYMYELCALSNLCIRVRLCSYSDLFRMYTTCALEATYAYEYGFALKSTYCVPVWIFLYSDLCVQGTDLCVKRLILQVLSCLFQLGYDSREDAR